MLIPNSSVSLALGNGTTKNARLKPQKSILGPAFSKCSSLISITIGNGLTHLGDLPFADRSCLTSVTFLGDARKFRVDPFRESSSTIYRQANTQG